jgi:hypothetical protein
MERAANAGAEGRLYAAGEPMQRASTGAGAVYGAKDAIDTRNGEHLAHAGRPPDGHLRGCGVAESEVKAQIRRRSESGIAKPATISG